MTRRCAISSLGHLASGLTLVALTLASCGGGSSSGPGGGGPPHPPPDFSLSIQPTSVSLARDSSATVTVGVTGSNGFNSPVNVTITGTPVGVTASPSQFSLASGGQQTVLLAADTTAGFGSASLTVTASSGSLSHTGRIALAVNPAEWGMHPPFRTRYLRTDNQWDYGFLSYFPQLWIVYEPVTKRFFASNTYLNRVDVFDAITELKVGEIAVPGAWVGDVTPDHTSIYFGTQIGDLYQIDPISMTVTKRIPAVQIGPAGYPAYEARVLADGRLVLLGGQGGIPAVDGYASFAVWNPADNSLQEYRSSYGGGSPPVCGSLGNVAEFGLTADRTKILLGSTFSDYTICLLDPSTGDYRVVQHNWWMTPFLVPPDGNEILMGSPDKVSVYDANELYLADRFEIGDGTGSYRYVLSYDGNTLFALPRSGGPALAYDWRTHEQKGWIANFRTDDLIDSITPQAVDETGLIAGVMGQGVAFLDGGAVIQGTPGPASTNGFVQPSFGPELGETPVQITGGIPSTASLKDVYFGNQLALGASFSSPGIAATTPPGLPGPVDVAVTARDDGLALLPESFSYGPWVVEVTPDASPAEGGGTGILYGYGFGPTGYNAQAPDLKVQVGGQTATITSYSGQQPPSVFYPFPIEFVQFTIPAGTAGSKADITVTNAAGSTTVKGAFQYLPATQQFPLPGAVLAQGIYDAKRDLYYFTDQTQIRVFSRPLGQWLAPIIPPGASRLWGISLSPDGNQLAATDAANNVLYVLNPDFPSALSSFALLNSGLDYGTYPCGVVITDSGWAYYASFSLSYTGTHAFHRLDTATGAVTHYDWRSAGAYGADAYVRLLLSKDNRRIYLNWAGGAVGALDTVTDTVFFSSTVSAFDYELTLSSNGTWMSGSEYLMDTNLNPASYLVLNARQIWNQSAVYGEKLSPDGNLLFAPLLNGIDVFDGRTGVLRTRIALSVTLSPNYDALVATGIDNVLVAITGQTGDGIAVIDLTSLPEPLPLPYASLSTHRVLPMRPGSMLEGKKESEAEPRKAQPERILRRRGRMPHIMNNLAIQSHIRGKSR